MHTRMHIAKYTSYIPVILSMLLVAMVASVHFVHWPTRGQFVVVRSGSMEPAIRTGSLLWLTARASYAPDDIIAYKHPDSSSNKVLVLHRIIEQVDDFHFSTKGDANALKDRDLVHIKAIIGKPILIIPLVGYGIAWMQTGVGISITIVMPLVIIAVQVIQKMTRNKVFRKNHTC